MWARKIGDAWLTPAPTDGIHYINGVCVGCFGEIVITRVATIDGKQAKVRAMYECGSCGAMNEEALHGFVPEGCLFVTDGEKLGDYLPLRDVGEDCNICPDCLGCIDLNLSSDGQNHKWRCECGWKYDGNNYSRIERPDGCLFVTDGEKLSSCGVQ